MVGRIPSSFISNLLEQIDIIDIIDSRIKLNKRGKNYTACCPFHDEKTPSFTVSPKKQFYHCFGCGVHGNAVDFLMQYEQYEFIEAIEQLASFIGLKVPREQYDHYVSNRSKSITDKQNLYLIMRDITNFYIGQLTSPGNKIATNYLRNRGISSKVIHKFLIGYVPNKWDLVRNYFSKQHNMLIDTGVLVKNDFGNCYDRFRGRIIFPIRDRLGRIIGFGGRVLDDSKPKYINSPETIIFKKGKELYGLYEVIKSSSILSRVLVVEGYMDVIALSQYELNYTVASLGTSITGEQLKILFRQTSTVICCYDGDQSGEEAAWRTLKNSLKHLKTGKTLKFLFLPKNEDPDSYIRQYGKNKFERLIEGATSLSTYLFQNLIKIHKLNLGTDEGKSAFRSYVIKLIDKIPDYQFQELLGKLLDQRTGFDNHFKHLKKHLNKSRLKLDQKIKRTPMREVIILLIQNPSYANLVPDLSSIKGLALPGLDLLFEVLDYCRACPHVSTGQLLESWRYKKNKMLLSRLASYMIPLDENNQEDVFLDSLDKILSQCIEKQIELLQAKDRSIGLPTGEKKKLLALMLDLKS
ncbi:DNA primase [Candidatus Photodesmus anomalopis]|uniref:DNA primase n=1 Tax=Candidatus Photodesmus katoptron Akat1 TaxID=1236703 RepID=S3DJ74_9GAMM|nr:DNA primase [Candidatus Photodesmus katoptron]EPE37745.1 DNA primase [Candidatus Photodesmus katoptron Akat1]